MSKKKKLSGNFTKIIKKEKLRAHCPHCGTYEIKQTSDGTILCKNKNCLRVSPTIEDLE